MKVVAAVDPGMHPNFRFNEFSPTEKLILSELRKRWYLTNSGRDIEAGTSTYRFILIKPTTKFQTSFGLEREICLIFSPYESFEPRTLDAYDRALKHVSSVRLDSVCRVLVSKDKEICDKISALSAQEPEQPTTVPFTYDELVGDKTGDLVFNRFRNFFFSRDIFSVQGPLRSDTFFFGRARLVQDLVDRFKSGENSGLFGLRKSGKTSVVYSLIRWSLGRDEKVVLIDCESPSVHGLRWYQLLERIVSQYREAKESNLKIGGAGRYNEINASDLFSEDVKKIHASKKASPALFVFDEIERISPKTASSKHWLDGDDFVYFWQSIRSLIQEFPGLINFLIVGTNPQSVEESKVGVHDNPLFALVPSSYVPCFKYEQTKDMVETLGSYMGLNFDPQVISKLQEDFGGHPFLTRQVCSQIHKGLDVNRPVVVDLSVYADAYSKFIKSGAAYLGMVVDVLREQFPEEYELLTMLAQGKVEDYESVASIFLINHLEGYGLVERQLKGPVISVNAVKAYMLALHRYEIDLDSDERRRNEINERSNALEIALRGLIRRSLRVANSEAKSVELVLNAVPSDRRSKLIGISYRELLRDEGAPLFLLDLKSIIDRSWDSIFKNIFPVDKQRFLTYFDDVNEARRIPAHAKAISKDDFSAWRALIKRFETWVADVC
jgi:hypothetical protein